MSDFYESSSYVKQFTQNWAVHSPAKQKVINIMYKHNHTILFNPRQRRQKLIRVFSSVKLNTQSNTNTIKTLLCRCSIGK